MQCSLEDFEDDLCPVGSKVGKSLVTAALPVLGTELPALEADVYNVEPVFGEAARFGLKLVGNEVFLRGDVAWDGDYHEGFTIDVPETLPSGLGGLSRENRVFDGLPATAPSSHAEHLSRGSVPQRPSATSTRPTCSRGLGRKPKNPATSSRRARRRRSSRRSRQEPNQKAATRSRTTPNWT